MTTTPTPERLVLQPCPSYGWEHPDRVKIPTNVAVEYTRADLCHPVEVGELEWDGFRSGPYEIVVHEGGIADLFNHADRDEDGNANLMQGGYLTLISIDDFKAAAQADYERRILSSLKTAPQTPDLGDKVRQYLIRMDDELLARDGSAELSHQEAKDALRDVYLLACGKRPEHYKQRVSSRRKPATISVQQAAQILLDRMPNYAMERAALESIAVDDEGEFPSLTDLLDFSGQNKAYTVVRAALVAVFVSLAEQKEQQ